MSGGPREEGRLHYRREGPVVTLVFDRPEARNAMTWAMYEALDTALERIRDEEGVRAVVLRGARGHFVAGTDIAQFREFSTPEDGVRYEQRLDALLARLEAFPVPTLAVVEGACVGGGLMLATVCDLRICTPDARFGMPIARTVGNCLSLPNTTRLVAQLGPARTKQLLLLAGFLGADEAKGCGFVLDVADREDLDTRVGDLTARLVAHAPVTLQVSKEGIRRVSGALDAIGVGVDRVESGEAPDPLVSHPGEDLVRRAYGSRDFQEGVAAFLEKRKPRWEGR